MKHPRQRQRGYQYRVDQVKSYSALEARNDRLSGKRRMVAGGSLKFLDQLLSELKTKPV
jgi:hypothetical protein